MKTLLFNFFFKIVLAVVVSGVFWIIEWLMSKMGMCSAPGLWSFLGFAIFLYAVQVIYVTYLAVKEYRSEKKEAALKPQEAEEKEGNDTICLPIGDKRFYIDANMTEEELAQFIAEVEKAEQKQ